jgi:hypothetical protein
VVGPVGSRSEFELLIGRRGFVTFALERLVAKPPIPSRQAREDTP